MVKPFQTTTMPTLCVGLWPPSCVRSTISIQASDRPLPEVRHSTGPAALNSNLGTAALVSVPPNRLPAHCELNFWSNYYFRHSSCLGIKISHFPALLCSSSLTRMQCGLASSVRSLAGRKLFVCFRPGVILSYCLSVVYTAISMRFST